MWNIKKYSHSIVIVQSWSSHSIISILILCLSMLWQSKEVVGIIPRKMKCIVASRMIIKRSVSRLKVILGTYYQVKDCAVG